MGFKLTIEEGKGRGQSFDFDAEEITIGRTDENDVVLYDGGVSRQHAKIAFDGTRWMVQDLDSANGTTLNGARIAREVLENGDQIGIGQAVFRFEAAATQSPTTTGSATRIVSVADAEKEAAKKRAGPSAKASAKEAAAAIGADPRLVRGIALGVVVVCALIVFAVVHKHAHDSGLVDCPAELTLKAGIGAFVFGHGVDADCQASDSGLTFTFTGAAKTRYLLHYAAFFVHSDELAVVVNGRKIATAPAALSRKAERQTLVLPDGAVKTGANKVVFVDQKDPDATWGLERLELEPIPLAAASLEKAEEARQLGEKLYDEKNIAAPNLYNAWMELREARKYYEGLEQKPIGYQTTLQNLASIEKELDKVCQNKLFDAQKDAMYGKYEDAAEMYQFILAAFPGEEHPCRDKAQERMQNTQARAQSR